MMANSKDSNGQMEKIKKTGGLCENLNLCCDRRNFIKTVGLFSTGALIGSMLPANLVRASGPQQGGTLSMLVQPEVPTLAGYLSTSMPVGQTASKVYDGLLEYNFDLSPRACLAESWNVSDDGMTITFKLQRGVKFHDGKPFTSADVKFSIEVLSQYHPRGKGNFAQVQSIETPDDYTVILKMNNPSPSMMMAFSGYESPIIPKHLFEGTDVKASEYANKPIGTGPFKFVEWKRGQYMRFDRNPNYWRKDQPYLDRVVVRTIHDTATRSAVLEKGEAHLTGFGGVPYNDAARLAKFPSIVVTTKGYENFSPIVELGFNTKQAPFDNKKVRQAVAYAIDRKFVIENIWFGFGNVATGPINSNFRASGLYTDDVKNYDVPNRLDLANQLLDEAGYPKKENGIRFEINHDLTPYGEEYQRFGEYTAQQLQKIGIKVKIRYEDVATWLRRIYTNYDFQMTSNWLNTFADPVLGVHRLYHSKEIKPGTVFKNASRWSSPRTDELMDKATVEPDPRKRAQYYHEFQKILTEEVPVTWILEIKFPTVYNAKFVDLINTSIGICGSFNSAYIKA